MHKRTGVRLFLVLFAAFLFLSPAVAFAKIFDVVVLPSVSDGYDYAYNLYYSDAASSAGDIYGISHWWLQVNCAHSTIDESSIYGYSLLNDQRYDWAMTFDDNVGQVGGYTDWVIKWDAPGGDVLDPLKVPAGLIGSFGFHSNSSPVNGLWGAKGSTLFDSGATLIPDNCSPATPEPASLSLLGLGLLGLLGFKKKK